MLWLLPIFVNVLAPVFIILGVAYVATRRLQLEGRTLSRLAYYVLTPAFVFNLISTARIEAALAMRMVAFITLVYVGSVAMAFLVARLLRRSRKMTIAYMMIAAFGNVGNFGLPISQFAQGEAALLPATIYFLANLAFAFVLCVLLANSGHRNPVRAFAQVVRTPSLIALAPAMLINAAGIQLPTFAARTVELLAVAMIAIMLIALGVQFANAGIPPVSLDMLMAAGIRLISGPLLAFALVGFFDLPALERNVGILQASMPAAVLVSIIALENNVLPEFVTATVLFSNLASMVTLLLVLAAL
ncbi:MAG: AEC family transporter [Chloroflexi bacterium]|jgi:predicted permease|uniref:Transporter n=1 Tax=Candidatus Thermofonsia Clade 3 bacterium TaxID=2364212 RepID=A0A2M8QDJ5_9CHLR|nr:AEC family transporter [Candidatus Roseilinea sp. NK_OTU-006]PJF47822.1 MAG: transporter [Candidatus Thermofonsia Clade 3 bacterium]RMG63132.1 MAG: AEC family transporter [Chloroflexota bacterium]